MASKAASRSNQLRFDVISIGTLSRNRLWNETEASRTAHATTTLIRAGGRFIIVDPGLPPMALRARLQERAGILPTQIDTVFLTNARPAHRGGLSLFSQSNVLIHEVERQASLDQLNALIHQAPEEDVDRAILERELATIESFSAAPDELVEHLDLFPLFGYTPGTCGLLLELPTLTVLIAGDAVPTQDHFLAGQVLPDTQNIAMAQEALAEVYEIADVIVPGHDNLFLNPRSAGM